MKYQSIGCTGLLSILLLLTVSITSAQHKAPKFGKFTDEEMNMTSYAKDSSAEAVYLFEDGYANFEVSLDQELEMVFRKHFRIKILKKEAFDLGNYTIGLYNSKGNKEKLFELKASTFNLVGNKMVESKVEKSNIFKENTENWERVKIAFPDVKEGSIIELSYRINSGFFYNMPSWDFQGRHPKIWSQYELEIPEYYQYGKFMKGFMPFTVNNTSIGSRTYTFTVRSSGGDRFDGVGGSGGSNSAASQAQMFTPRTENLLYVMDSVAAFRNEAYVDCDENYIQSIEFELNAIKYPNSMPRLFASSWESVNKQMWESNSYGQLIKNRGYLQDIVAEATAGATTELEKAIRIYKYIQRNYNWDGHYRLFAVQENLRPVVEKKTGSSTELNLLLVALLKNAGLNASPVMISTRSHGASAFLFPSITKFNTTITQVIIDDKAYLLDATEGIGMFGMLPVNDLNGRGRLINENDGDWIELQPRFDHKLFEFSSMSINKEDGSIHAEINRNYKDYASLELLKKNNPINRKEEYIKAFLTNHPGVKINQYNASIATTAPGEINDTMQLDLDGYADVIGNKILVKPLLLNRMESSPFKSPTRDYPINYTYNRSEMFTTLIDIPEGYKIAYMPKSERINFGEDKDIQFEYIIREVNNQIILNYKFDINRIVFLADEYEDLKMLYDHIVRKHQEEIIFEKN